MRSVQIIELAGWDLDPHPFRPCLADTAKLDCTRRHALERDPYTAHDDASSQPATDLRSLLDAQCMRPDLQAEMRGLDWSIEVVDLRTLLAFQRRLAFDSSIPLAPIPDRDDWPGLVNVSFPPAKPIRYELSRDSADGSIQFRSCNPDLHLRVSTDPASPITIHGGGCFLEAARYRGRAFLRDGYHRAYRLLKAGVAHIPAVVVRAGTLKELGADQQWFFPESVLFSSHPPMVHDFLDDRLTLSYTRPPLIKTIHIAIEETFSPVSSHCNTGDSL